MKKSTAMHLLNTTAAKSLCLSRKIGAMITDPEDHILSVGWNGPLLPCDLRYTTDKDLRERLGILNNEVDLSNTEGQCPRKLLNLPSGQGLEICPALHAEARAIAYAGLQGVSTAGAFMYVSCGVPCNQCLLLIIAAGLTRVYVENLNHYDKLTSLVLEHTHLKILLMED